ncbi:hypothetical protein [Dasineura jujubifolia toursvirus 2a]|nr:hypothetical protein [Dasineura jujubifolia toursvirus 2a]
MDNITSQNCKSKHTSSDYEDVTNKFCCYKKCIEAPETQVDGKACKICSSFCYCRCKCQTYMEYVNQQNKTTQKI